MEDEEKNLVDLEGQTTKKSKPKKKKKAVSKKKPASSAKGGSASGRKKKQATKTEEKPAVPAGRQEPPKLQFETKPSLKKHKNNSSKGALLALVLAFVVVIIAGGWYQTQQLNKSNQDATVNLDEKLNSEVGFLKEKLQKLASDLELQKQEPVQEEVNLLTYTNPELGFTFQYAKELGAVESSLIPNDEANPNDDILRLTFSANPDLWINFTGGEYAGEEPFTYSGSETDLVLICPTPLEITETGFCDTKLVSNQQTVEQVKAVGEDILLNIVKTIRLNLSGDKYKGMTFNLGLGLPPVTGRSLFAPTDEEVQQEALLEFYRNILKKERLSLVVKENIDFYDQILSTLTVQ